MEKWTIRMGLALLVVGGVGFWWSHDVPWLLAAICGAGLIIDTWIRRGDGQQR